MGPKELFYAYFASDLAKRQKRIKAIERDARVYDRNFRFKDVIEALKLADHLARYRPKDDLFSDPLLITELLVKYSHADTDTIVASILYPIVRPLYNQGVDVRTLDQIEKRFKKGYGAMSKERCNCARFSFFR